MTPDQILQRYNEYCRKYVGHSKYLYTLDEWKEQMAIYDGKAAIYTKQELRFQNYIALCKVNGISPVTFNDFIYFENNPGETQENLRAYEQYCQTFVGETSKPLEYRDWFRIKHLGKKEYAIGIPIWDEKHPQYQSNKYKWEKHIEKSWKDAGIEINNSKIDWEKTEQNIRNNTYPSEKENEINKPNHYTWHPSGVECKTIAQEFCYNIGTVIAYLWRAGFKESSTRLVDLKKAREHLDFEIALEELRISKEFKDISKKDTAIFSPADRRVHQLMTYSGPLRRQTDATQMKPSYEDKRFHTILNNSEYRRYSDTGPNINECNYGPFGSAPISQQKKEEKK